MLRYSANPLTPGLERFHADFLCRAVRRRPPGAWVVGALEGGALTQAAQRADKASGGALIACAQTSAASPASPGKSWKCWRPPGMKASRILLVGLGKPEEFDGAQGGSLGAPIVTGRLLASGETAATFDIEVPKGAKIKAAELAAHLALGARLRSYSFDNYRTKNLDELRADAEEASRSAHPMSRGCQTRLGRSVRPSRTASSWPAIWSTSRPTCFTRRNSPAAPRRSPSSA